MSNRLDCTNPAEYSRSRTDRNGITTYCNTCLSTGEAIGLNYGGLSGLASLVAIIALFIIIARQYHKNMMNTSLAPWRLLRSNLDGFLLNLLVADIVMSIGGIMDLHWVASRQVHCGAYCTFQGFSQFVGETAVAMFTLSIALHTFTSIWLGRRLSYRPSLWITYSICVWIYVLLFALIAWAIHSREGHEKSFFAPTPFWCWINVEYKAAKYGEYLWLWTAGVGNLVIYSVLALLFCGCFGNQEQGDSRERRQLRCEGWLQLLNPLGYTVLVLPISIARWMYISKPSTPLTDPKASSLAAATLVFHATFRLSGLINALLVLFTRSGLLLINSTGELYHGDPRREWEEHRNGRQWEEEVQREEEGQQEAEHRQQEEQEVDDQTEEKRQREGDDKREEIQ
ncbi:Cyclic AMP receptor 1 [Rhizoctonia solani]|uniref:Cyclic AMP receptor 1 n=1 Tax=Rhizoctonia solani TaxID=456999 RepID=A0A0K6G6X4_9AGAM|nr:Cyclic AMP receptor 1 [Rhizoctonia solani]